MLNLMVNAILLVLLTIVMVIVLVLLIIFKNKDDLNSTIEYLNETGKELKTREDVKEYEKWKNKKKR